MHPTLTLLLCSYCKSVTTEGDEIYVRRTRTRKHDYFQLVRAYRNKEGRPRQEVLVHLGKYETPAAALAAWPAEIAEHRRNERNDQVEKLQSKLEKLRELTKGDR